MKLLLVAVLGCIASQALASPSYKRQKFDTFNGFDSYMTDSDYQDERQDKEWTGDIYDKEEVLVPQDPNSVYPDERDTLGDNDLEDALNHLDVYEPKVARDTWDDDDYETEQSGWYSDDEADSNSKEYDSYKYDSSESDSSKYDSSESDSSKYDSSEEYTSNEYAAYVADELNYIEEDVQFNEDRIYELEDDLNHDEAVIGKMDKRLKKMDKRLKSLQNLVNAMETERLSKPQKPYKREQPFDYY